MTREERHIAVLNRLLECMNVYDSVQPTEERKKAIKAAIQALSQEPTEKPMCDRNICISNEYNGIGCDKCIVNKEQEPKTQMVDKSNFDIEQYKMDLQGAYDCGFEAGKKAEQEPCDDVISRQDAIDAIYEHEFSNWCDKDEVSTILNDLPSVMQKSETVTEFADRCRECGARYGELLKQKSGKWQRVSIEKYIQHAMAYYECSECGGQTIGEPNYCPNCGAKMVEPQESEDKG